MKTPAEICSWLNTARKAFPGSSLVALADLVHVALAARHASDHAANESDHVEAEVTFDAAMPALAEAVGFMPTADAETADFVAEHAADVAPDPGWQDEVMARIRANKDGAS